MKGDWKDLLHYIILKNRLNETSKDNNQYAVNKDKYTFRFIDSLTKS